MEQRYDAIVIGAGMSGLAAGIRLAQAGRRVAILERHYLWGGLNSFYKLAGRRFDVGLHALTNWAPPRTRGAPLTRLLRQLRLRHADLRLGEQRRSAILFPGARLSFSNDPGLLEEEVARAFPGEVDGYRRLVARVRAWDDAAEPARGPSARDVLGEELREPLLREMLLLPVLYYGSPTAHDLPFGSFAVLFRSVFLEGLCRPEGGIRTLLDLLVRRFREEGGELRMRCGVRRVVVEHGVARGVVLDDGTELAAERVLSSAGRAETLRLAGRDVPPAEEGRLSFLESISVLDADPAQLGIDVATAFLSSSDRPRYAEPEDGLVDAGSSVVSVPSNFASSAPPPEGLVRLTVLASHPRFLGLDEEAYRAEKERCADLAIDEATRHLPDWRPRTVFRDVFTPRTIERFTGHVHGAVYGSPVKAWGGESGVDGLVLIGTDQGWLGVVGALVSGVAMANRHVLSPAAAAS